MAITILSLTSDTFSINGVSYSSIFQPLKVGADYISIYNAFDSRTQILGSTHFSEFVIDGNSYGTQALTMAALLPVVYRVVGGGGGGSGEWGLITGILSAQTDLQAALDGKMSVGTFAAWADITGKPTTLAGYGITDAFTSDEADALYLPIAGTAVNSAKLAGYSLSTDSGASTVVLRNSVGDINARLFRSEYDVANASIGYIMTQVDTDTNNFIRPSTPAQFRAAVTDAQYLTIGGTAANSQLLDSIDSTQFLRSDTADSKTSGDLVFNDNVQLQFGTSNDSRIFSSGSNTYLDLIVGNLYIRNNTTTKFTFDRTAGNLTATGNINAAGFFETSLREVKENIRPYDLSALDIIMDTDIVRFDKKDGSAVNKIGLIIDESHPDFANEEQNAVDIYKTLFLAVKAIQELTIEVEYLRQKI